MTLEVRTIVGIAMKINGNLRPNVEVTNPKMMLPSNPPKQGSEATQDASSIVILPVGNGDSFDVRINVLGDAHP